MATVATAQRHGAYRYKDSRLNALKFRGHLRGDSRFPRISSDGSRIVGEQNRGKCALSNTEVMTLVELLAYPFATTRVCSRRRGACLVVGPGGCSSGSGRARSPLSCLPGPPCPQGPPCLPGSLPPVSPVPPVSQGKHRRSKEAHGSDEHRACWPGGACMGA